MAVTSDAAAVRELEARLHRPDRGENGHREGAETRTRLETLARLREFAEEGKVRRDGRAGGINTHIHTSKSFSFFDSPSDAAWQAYLARVAVLGINDHNTLAGHEEFGKATRILGIRSVLGMETLAVWGEAADAGAVVNDPSCPGRTYISAKGVTRELAPGSGGAKDLARASAAQLERAEAATRKAAETIAKRLKIRPSISWDDVLAATPHGQAGERHVALITARFLEKAFPGPEERRDAVARFAEEEPPAGAVEDTAALQDFLRPALFADAAPARGKGSTGPFLPLERAVSLSLELGAIPTYPVLGNPVTPWEEDIDGLLDRLEAAGIRAVEVIPDRNTRERLGEIVRAAAARGFPVFNGTEHNTKAAAPLVDRFFFDDEFRPHFERGARVLLGHQALRAAGEEGYVREDGTLPADREANLGRVEEAGRKRVQRAGGTP
jgi:hypothetical protein